MTEIKEEKFPVEIVKLPSKGLLYPLNSPLASGKIEMKYMTAKEEDILSTQSYINQGIVLDELFKAMIVSNIEYEDILLGDKNAIMLAARKFGYGETYETSIKKEDGTEIPFTVNLSEVPFKDFDETLITPNVNRFKWTLPKGENEIEFKLLTSGDNNKIEADIKGMKKLGKKRATATWTTRLRYMILTVDGSEEKKDINAFVNTMLAIDSRAFRQYVTSITPDVDLSIEMEDPETGENFQGDIELGLDMFYPDYKG